MHALGKELVLELRKCNPEILKDVLKIKEIFIGAAEEAGATIIDVSFHGFEPFGVSGMIIIGESHLAIHDWPEYSYAYVNICTCGEVIDPYVAAYYIIDKLGCKDPSITERKIGIMGDGREKLPHKITKP